MWEYNKAFLNKQYKYTKKKSNFQTYSVSFAAHFEKTRQIAYPPMFIYDKIFLLTAFIEQTKQKGFKTGFVPTMGALHAGHLSLIEQAREKCDVVISSIFVNPTQFNDKKDLDRYPRTLEADIKLLESSSCDVLFIPTVEEIYPHGQELHKKFDFGIIDKVLEGSKRPGHFDGVAQVVSRLFEIVQPGMAFFGQKDFQQCLIIQSLVKQLKLPLEIEVCPIIREADGLAMSSRNTLLSTEERKAAAFIPHCLKKLKTLYDSGVALSKITHELIAEINQQALLQLDYLEVRKVATLEPADDNNGYEKGALVALIAVYAGKIRLIDNLLL